MRNVIWI